jgi:predicted peptidase
MQLTLIKRRAQGRLKAVCLPAVLSCMMAISFMSSAATGKQLVKAFDFKTAGSIRLNYLLHLPAEYKADATKKWPLILFLHGAGERGTNIWKVATHGPPHLATTNASFPFIVVSPQCPEGQYWQGEPLLGLLDAVMKEYSVDHQRVYLTGLSMGGYGTWELGTTHPERFAAIAPICGGGHLISVLLTSREKGSALKSLGVWAFHGAKDPVVPLEESERMVGAMKEAGARDVKLTVYPEAQHNSWTQAYDDPELYKWFLAHKREGALK